MPQPILVYVTAANDEQARRIARALVTEGLAACCAIHPMRSVYSWKGELHEDAELQLLIKTDRACFDALEARIIAEHSYEVPEILAVDVVAGHGAYLDWLTNQLNLKD